MDLKAIFGEMSPRARIGMGAALVGILLVSFMLLRLATAPSYATVMTGIQPGDSDKITQALADRGVAYELQQNGTALAVKSGSEGEARVALANAGVSTGGAGNGQPGFELLDEQKLGASDFQQRVTYQRALEGEIARTIGQVNGVSGAEVQLTLPEDELFSSEAKPATAAVLLSGASQPDPSAVRGIASLVASSVTGLSADKVTITDGTGQMLWPTGEASGGASAKVAADAKYATQLEANINDMLTRTLGPNKARVEVAADLNMDEQQREELAYADKGTPLERSTDKETLQSDGPGGGVAGTAANIEGTQAAGAGGGSDYRHTTEKESLGVGKTVTKTKVAPGAVNKMQVSLLLDSSVGDGSPSGVNNQALQDMVAAAAGLDTQRGDTITTTQLPFAKVPDPKAPSPFTPTTAIDILKYVLAGLAGLVFLFLASRSLKRREQGALAEPTWLREIESPQPLSELVASLEAGATAELEPATPQEQLARVAAEHPERLARQLRRWMQEESA